MNASLYLRVSTDEQAREGFSIAAQRDRLLAFCQAQDWTVVDVYSDEGHSGAKLDRPALTRLRRDAGTKKFDLVLAWKVDRLSRKVSQLAALVEEFDRAGIAFRSVTEPFDTSHAAGRAFMQMLGVFAELERENIRERSKLGIRKRVESGLIHGRPVMIGYQNTEPGRWEVDPEGAGVVRWIFDQYLAGVGSFRIAQQLKSGNISGLSEGSLREEFGQATLSSTADRVRWILRNPIYAGYAPIGEDRYPGRHEAIIAPTDWDRAQQLMDSRQSVPNRAHTSSYMLSGRIFCGLCGGAMYGRREPSRAGPKARAQRPYYEYYVCSNSTVLQGQGKTCTLWGVRSDDAHEQVIAAIRQLAADPTALTVGGNTDVEDTGLSKLTAERRSLVSALGGLEKRQRKWYRAFESAPDLEDTAIDRLRELADEQRRLTTRLADVERQLKVHGAPLARDEVVAYLAHAAQVIDKSDADQCREIVRTLVRRVLVIPTGRRIRGNAEKQVRVEFYPV